MQNSAVMAIRITVLLAVLVAVPVVAIWGKNVPEVVKSLLRNFTDTPAKVNSANADASDAPVFRPGLLGATASPAAHESNAPASLPGTVGLPASGLTSNHAESGLPRPMPVESAGRAAASQAKIASSGGTAVHAAGDEIRSAPVVSTIAHQVDALTDSGNQSNRQLQSNSPAGESNGGRFPPDYFRAAESRLRGMGATYYLLETSGPHGDAYRFLCKVAGGGVADQSLSFVAVERDPLAAMNNVVRQVETWRSRLTP